MKAEKLADPDKIDRMTTLLTRTHAALALPLAVTRARPAAKKARRHLTQAHS
jgi:hypothetical protein